MAQPTDLHGRHIMEWEGLLCDHALTSECCWGRSFIENSAQSQDLADILLGWLVERAGSNRKRDCWRS